MNQTVTSKPRCVLNQDFVYCYTPNKCCRDNIKFTQEDVRGDSLPFLDCAVHTEEDRSLTVEVYRKPTHTDQYLLFVPTMTEGKEKEQKHIRGAFKTCGYPNWTFYKTSKRSRADREEENRKN